MPVVGADRRVLLAVALEGLDQDRVVDPLAVPQILDREEAERPQQLLAEGHQPGLQAAAPVDREVATSCCHSQAHARRSRVGCSPMKVFDAGWPGGRAGRRGIIG